MSSDKDILKKNGKCYISKKINKLFNGEKIIVCNLPEYKSYFSPKLKYPLLVIENVKKTNKGKIELVRTDVEDPFRPFEELNENIQLTADDFKELKRLGSSPGHLAPAGQHKNSFEAWSSTFYHINMVPQNIVINSGIWMVLERWCSYIGNNPTFRKLFIASGVIPDKESIILQNGNKVNNPKFCYKIILAKTNRNIRNNNIAIAVLLVPNEPIEPQGEALDLSKYLIEPEKLSQYLGYDANRIISHIIKSNNLIPHSKKVSNTKKNDITKKKSNSTLKHKKDDYTLTFLGDELKGGIKYELKGNILKFIKNSIWFGKIIYSKSIEELEKNWKSYQELNEKEKLNKTTEFHEEYYNLAKERLIKDKL